MLTDIRIYEVLKQGRWGRMMKLGYASLSAIVQGAYEAALDDTLWLNWSTETARAFGGIGATFWVMNVTQGAIERFSLLGPPEALAEDYARNWGPFDPQVPFVVSRKGACVYTSNDHVNLANRDVAGYVAWQKRVGKVDHHLGFAAFLDRKDYLGGLAIHRAVDGGAPSETDRQQMTALLPDLQRAMQLGFRHSQVLGEAHWSDLSPLQDEPALLLDERGRVCRTTRAAFAMLNGELGLTIKGGHLQCFDPAANGRLDALIGRVISRIGGSGAMRLALPSGMTFALVAYPLPWSRRTLAPFQSAALVRIILPQHRRGMQNLYREAFDLTRRQADLAALLMDWHSVESAASIMGISIATARLHLRQVLEKTSTSKQSELVNLLSRF